MKIAEIPSLAIRKFFPVIMIVGIIVAWLTSRLTNDKPEVLIAVAGTIATIFSIHRNSQKIQLSMEYNGRKVPDWVPLLSAAILGIVVVVAISFVISFLSRIQLGFIMAATSCIIALSENRRLERQFIVLSAEVLFQLTLIVQGFVIIAIIRNFVAITIVVIAIFSFLLSFFLCLQAYRIERNIQKKIEEQINAREDE